MKRGSFFQHQYNVEFDEINIAGWMARMYNDLRKLNKTNLNHEETDSWI